MASVNLPERAFFGRNGAGSGARRLCRDAQKVRLAWSIELCGSRAGFVVDSQGFVIACRGNVPNDSFEGMGADLCFAMEQMAKLDPGGALLHAVDLQLETQTLTAIRITGADDATGFILGLVGCRRSSVYSSPSYPQGWRGAPTKV